VAHCDVDVEPVRPEDEYSRRKSQCDRTTNRAERPCDRTHGVGEVKPVLPRDE
jgi:hypothetical protein